MEHNVNESVAVNEESGETTNVTVKSGETTNVTVKSEETTNVTVKSEVVDGCSSSTSVEQQQVEDKYYYTKTGEFTSEVHKIEITGLRPKFGFGELKKLLNQKLNLNSHKVKTSGPFSKIVFVTFRCEEDREKALKVLNGYKWKGKCLSVKKANPAADPLVRKRQNENYEDDTSGNQKRPKEDESLPIGVRLKNIIMPLWEKPYEKQLLSKQAEIENVLVRLGRQIDNVWPATPVWLQEAKLQCRSMCTLEDIRPSPVVKQYRNKCEFTVGLDPIQGERTVGFRLSSYKAGSMKVADPSECSIVPDKALDVCRAFQDYVRQSDKEPYNPEKYTGYWRQLTVRMTENDCLAVVVMHPQSLSISDIEAIKNDLKRYFEEGSGNSCGITSLFFQSFAKRVSGEELQFEHLSGERHITESLLDLKFRISPDAFFQVNAVAAEVLYRSIGELASVDKDTVLLDICCGTGAIGISLARKVQKVIGIEMVANAIEDAEFNAKLNELDNIEFHFGKVEDVLSSILHQLPSTEDVVVVIDPPRAGLHNKVIKTIRSTNSLRRLVYVSCDLSAASRNLVDLCRPESNNYHGKPFIPVKAVPVDLFPQTNHFEVVILLERDNEEPIDNSKK